MNILKSLAFAVMALSATALMSQEKEPKPVLTTNTDEVAIAAVRKSAEQLTAAFNAGKADDLATKFLPKGELIDEGGTVYQGEKEIKELLTAFFKRFPETTLTLDIESIRIVGPVAIEEGRRTMKTKDGAVKSQFRYLAVWAKANDVWKLASHRDFADDPAPTPGERLQPLAWMVGDWINEGADGTVAISFKWSEDKNFLLGEFQLGLGTGPKRKSSQRIGWDPIAGKIRSWLFDADGGFADGHWTLLEDEIVIKSSSVNPDSSTASATLTIARKDQDHFSIAGTDRIVGDDREPNFELTVARRPPAASK